MNYLSIIYRLTKVQGTGRTMEQSTKTAILQRLGANPLYDLTRVEDYIEVVYELVEKKGYARPMDIAEKLNVKAASVTYMLRRLHSMGLILYERYRGLTLTASGERLARSVQQKHLTILRFLRLLGIEESTARLDAEGIEHHVHKGTIDRMTRFVQYVAQHPSWYQAFRKTLK
jgi:DtxR family manganese transport transcriptional regulator